MQDISASDKTKLATSNPAFACVISYTATSEIPGLTVAGANPELIKYTSPADSEFLYYGRCRCIDTVPATPDGKPTPAIITRAALQSAKMPLLVVDAGSKVKPTIPLVSFGLEPGKNIMHENAMNLHAVRQAFDFGRTLGHELARMSDLVVVGESIPGGTTTTLAVLTALGVDAKFKVSSSMPENPHELKNRVVASAMERAGISAGKFSSQPFEAVTMFGDPMMPSVAGIADGALSSGCRAMLAGGTQMSSVVAILQRLSRPLKGLCIGTTAYVAKDPSSDLASLIGSIARVPVFSCDLHLDESSKPGLQAFAKGFVKEGVGAGGASIAAMLKSKGKLTGKKLMRIIEKEYETSIEANLRRSHLDLQGTSQER